MKPLMEYDFTKHPALKENKPLQTISRPCSCCDSICSPEDSKLLAPASRCPHFHLKPKNK